MSEVLAMYGHIFRAIWKDRFLTLVILFATLLAVAVAVVAVQALDLHGMVAFLIGWMIFAIIGWTWNIFTWSWSARRGAQAMEAYLNEHPEIFQ